MDARVTLLKILEPGDTIYFVRFTRSKPGNASIRLYHVRDDVPQDITLLAARVMGKKVNDNNAISVQGGGVNPGQHLVELLDHCLETETVEYGKIRLGLQHHEI